MGERSFSASLAWRSPNVLGGFVKTTEPASLANRSFRWVPTDDARSQLAGTVAASRCSDSLPALPLLVGQQFRGWHFLRDVFVVMPLGFSLQSELAIPLMKADDMGDHKLEAHATLH